jgi:hypothetical protein
MSYSLHGEGVRDGQLTLNERQQSFGSSINNERSTDIPRHIIALDIGTSGGKMAQLFIDSNQSSQDVFPDDIKFLDEYESSYAPHSKSQDYTPMHLYYAEDGEKQ